jgi:PAS domain S-box-containing protein
VTSALAPGRPVRILHLEDSALDADLVGAFLAAEGLDCRITRVWTREDFSAALDAEPPDLILADHSLPAFDGESALAIAREQAADVPFVFVSGTLGEEVAVEALRHGATDYVVKQRLERLPRVVRRALAESEERRERRRAEAALEVSEASFATLVNAMPLLCWMADAVGRPLWFNARWYAYTGLTREAALGDDWGGVHEPSGAPEARRRWIEAVEAGRPFEALTPLRGGDGRHRMFLTRAEPVRAPSGAVLRWLGTSTDISAQHEAEEALRRLNETLEQRVVEAIGAREAILAKLHETQRLETIGQLTGGVAHDFNNLLAPIVSSLDLLQRRTDDPRAQRLIAGALQAADRAKTLVQRLLAFARRQVLEPRAVDVGRLVADMAELIARSVGPRVRVETDLGAAVPAARVDPNQLELALLNLAVNARDAMPEGGALTIALSAAEVGPGDPTGLRYGGYVRLTVTDTGTGMDEETLRRAIEPFYSTKGVGKGTGLGLSMVHGLAAQSGGTLILRSRPGHGTAAEIWLPVADRTPVADGVAHPAAFAGRPARVMIVDDEAIVRSATAEMLADLGHQVIEASSGAQALQLLRDGADPELVITDYLMPSMDGAELARLIRAERPGMPILIATGYAGLAGSAMADLPLLAKPFRRTELGALVQRLTVAASGA